MINSKPMDIIIKSIKQNKCGIRTGDKRDSIFPYNDVYKKAKKILVSLNPNKILEKSIVVIAIDDFWKRLIITLACYIGHINHITLGNSRIENETILKELIENIDKFNFVISNEYEPLFQNDYSRKNIQDDVLLLSVNNEVTLYQMKDRKSYIKYNLDKYGCVLGREFNEDAIMAGIQSIAAIIDQVNTIVVLLPLFGSMSEIEVFLAATYYRKNMYVVKSFDEYEKLKKDGISMGNILLLLSASLKKDMVDIIYNQNVGNEHFERIVELSGKMDEVFVASLNNNESISKNIELYMLQGADFILYGYSIYKLDIGEISKIIALDHNHKRKYCLTKRDTASRNCSEFLLEEVDVKISRYNQLEDAGDIHIKGKKVFHNYFCLPLKTKKEFSNDGWFKTNYIGTYNSKNNKVCFRDKNTNLVWKDKVLFNINEFNTCINYVFGLNLEGYCCYFKNYIELENEIIYFMITVQSNQVYKQIYDYAADYFQNILDYDKFKIILVDNFYYNSNGELMEYMLTDYYIKEKSESVKITEEEKIVSCVNDNRPFEEKILQEVKEILEASTKIKNIDIDRNWNELKIDSLSSMYAINELELKYGIQIFENIIEGNYSVRLIVNYLLNDCKFKMTMI